MKQTEQLYQEHFEGADLKKAIRSLKKQSMTERVDIHQHGTVWRAGLFSGLSIALIISTLVNLGFDQVPLTQEQYFLLTVYGGLSIPIIFLYLFSLVLVSIQNRKINWVLIFELDFASIDS
jgi:hypothetical protein